MGEIYSGKLYELSKYLLGGKASEGPSEQRKQMARQADISVFRNERHLNIAGALNSGRGACEQKPHAVGPYGPVRDPSTALLRPLLRPQSAHSISLSP